MQRKHPLWFLLPLALLLSLAACSSQAPAADAPQEAAAYTVAPYTPTEQEQTLLQAYELTQDNTVAFTFQNPEGDPGPLRPDLSSGRGRDLAKRG